MFYIFIIMLFNKNKICQNNYKKKIPQSQWDEVWAFGGPHQNFALDLYSFDNDCICTLHFKINGSDLSPLFIISANHLLVDIQHAHTSLPNILDFGGWPNILIPEYHEMCPNSILATYIYIYACYYYARNLY